MLVASHGLRSTAVRSMQRWAARLAYGLAGSSILFLMLVTGEVWADLPCDFCKCDRDKPVCCAYYMGTLSCNYANGLRYCSDLRCGTSPTPTRIRTPTHAQPAFTPTRTPGRPNTQTPTFTRTMELPCGDRIDIADLIAMVGWVLEGRPGYTIATLINAVNSALTGCS